MEKETSPGRVFSAGRKLLSSITTSPVVLSIAGDFGYPAGLLQLIKSRPGLKAVIDESHRNVSADSVVRWHEWGQPYGDLKGWVKGPDSYHGITIKRHEFNKLGTREIVDGWACNICDVTGVSSSQSDLTEFSDLDSFVETIAPKYIENLTLEGLRENLSHYEIRILDENTSDYFAFFNWDGRVFLMNGGGSHHFAAARYVARRINRYVPLRGPLYRYGLNSWAIRKLRRDFDIFVLGEASGFNLDFNEAMRHYRADYFYADLPRPYTDLQAIFLPLQKDRSAKVAKIFRSEGFFDLGQYLQDLSFKGT